MSYTEDQTKQYLEILHNYASQPINEMKAKCSNCENR